MSKLFDQLKDAARSREEKSPGLLVDALKRQQETAAAGSPEPVTPGAPKEQRPGAQSADAVTPAQAGAQSRLSQFSGVALALLIFVVAVLAWRSSPFTPPRKVKIDPTELRLDRSLDLERPGLRQGDEPPGSRASGN